MVQAALITGETTAVVWKPVCTLDLSWGVILKTMEPWLHPRPVKSALLAWGPEGSISLEAPRCFQGTVKGGERQEGGLLAARVTSESLPYGPLTWGDVVIWLLMSLRILAHFPHVIMRSGSSLRAQILSACQLTEPLETRWALPLSCITHLFLLMNK